jgi:bifunctional UDP-N-acetylglucosamine pyrophosphorylase/glucosamine-1-phosphate N-acetyltransferase
VAIGPDTVVYPNVVIEGATEIGAECVIGAGCQITASRLADRVLLKPYCVLSDAVIEAEAQLGPFCHLRPHVHVGARARIGNFVEVKQSRIGRGAKAPHLSYIGDATVGQDVNVGAGAITCNYDGQAKHQTVIGDGAFIRLRDHQGRATGALAVERSTQVVKEGWVARRAARRGRGTSGPSPKDD